LTAKSMILTSITCVLYWHLLRGVMTFLFFSFVVKDYGK